MIWQKPKINQLLVCIYISLGAIWLCCNETNSFKFNVFNQYTHFEKQTSQGDSQTHLIGKHLGPFAGVCFYNQPFINTEFGRYYEKYCVYTETFLLLETLKGRSTI